MFVYSAHVLCGFRKKQTRRIPVLWFTVACLRFSFFICTLHLLSLSWSSSWGAVIRKVIFSFVRMNSISFPTEFHWVNFSFPFFGHTNACAHAWRIRCMRNTYSRASQSSRKSRGTRYEFMGLLTCCIRHQTSPRTATYPPWYLVPATLYTPIVSTITLVLPQCVHCYSIHDTRYTNTTPSFKHIDIHEYMIIMYT